MQEQPKLNEFDPPTLEAWRKLVERDLAGAAFERNWSSAQRGVEIQPLYTRADLPPGAADELPGFAPFTRGSYALGAVEMGWDVRQEIAHAAPERAAQAALENLNGGASSLLFKLDLAARALGEEHGKDGCALLNQRELAAALEHVALDKTPVALAAWRLQLRLRRGPDRSGRTARHQARRAQRQLRRGPARHAGHLRALARHARASLRRGPRSSRAGQRPRVAAYAR